jgi:hypothetical protein
LHSDPTRRSALGLVFAGAAGPALAARQAENPRRQIAARAADAVRAHYQDPAAAERLAAVIAANIKRGAYDAPMADEAFADRLTADLRAVVPDKHMAVMFDLPEGADPAADPVFCTRQNYGVQAVRRLGGNIGLIELNLAPAVSFGDALFDRYAAAMALVHDTRALIVDVRAHIGGEPAAVAYFTSYFFDRDPFVINRIRYRGRPVADFRTTANPRGPKYGERRPLLVLTSPDTFSGGEELAYDLQATGRARIVGRTTGGGANPNEAYALGGRFTALVPNGAAENPITGTNWEGVGVKPDVEAEPAAALGVAQRLALEAALAQADNEAERQSIRQAMAGLK